MSVTVTVKLPLAVLLRVSLAEQLTVVVAIGKVEPEAGAHVTGREPSTASLAVAVKLTTAPAELVACAVMLAGSVSTGRVVSCTVTVKLPLAVLLWVSLAEQLTVVVAIGKVEPEAGAHVTGREPSTASLAVAVKLTTAPAELVACAVMLAGSVSTGGVVSAGASRTTRICFGSNLGAIANPVSVGVEGRKGSRHGVCEWTTGARQSSTELIARRT